MADATCAPGWFDRHHSDGDLRASASPWHFRRQRQRQAASNYTLLLGRLSATEELLAAHQMEHTKQSFSQRETIVNLTLRLQMLEKVFVFMDWQKINILVDRCLSQGPCDTTTGSPHEHCQSLGFNDTFTGSMPPCLRQPEVEASPHREGNNISRKLVFENVEIDRNSKEHATNLVQTSGKEDVHEEFTTTPAHEQHNVVAGNEACEILHPEDDDNEQEEKEKKVGTRKTKVLPEAKEPKHETKEEPKAARVSSTQTDPKYTVDEEEPKEVSIEDFLMQASTIMETAKSRQTAELFEKKKNEHPII